LRVISGTAKGRKLKEPTGLSIRPTSAMVKESIFSIIQFELEGAQVLDLYAGTGQLGIEALSRGAAGTTFVDSSPIAVKLIRENLSQCSFSGNASVYMRDSLKFLTSSWQRYDIIFVDPPYGMPVIGGVLSRIIEFDKLNANGIIICETSAGSAMEDVPQPYFLKKEYRYGGVKILRYGRS